MKVWYRHSGESEIEEIPLFLYPFRTVEDVEEITSVVGDHYITHMCIREGGMTSSLAAICKRLTHLKLEAISNSSQLQK